MKIFKGFSGDYSCPMCYGPMKNLREYYYGKTVISSTCNRCGYKRIYDGTGVLTVTTTITLINDIS